MNKAKATICIREVSKTSKVEIFGHVFNDLSEIKKAVETYCRVERDSWDTAPKSPVNGLHVICIYEPYPCFDSEDYANEDRDYSNYFFTTKPFTKQQIDKLSKLPCRCNAQIVCDTMPDWAAPAVYYCGDGDKMIVATIS